MDITKINRAVSREDGYNSVLANMDHGYIYQIKGRKRFIKSEKLTYSLFKNYFEPNIYTITEYFVKYSFEEYKDINKVLNFVDSGKYCIKLDNTKVYLIPVIYKPSLSLIATAKAVASVFVPRNRRKTVYEEDEKMNASNRKLSEVLTERYKRWHASRPNTATTPSMISTMARSLLSRKPKSIGWHAPTVKGGAAKLEYTNTGKKMLVFGKKRTLYQCQSVFYVRMMNGRTNQYEYVPIPKAK